MRSLRFLCIPGTFYLVLETPLLLFFLQLDEIVSIYAYAFLTNFLESVLLLLLALLPAIVLPARWWKDHFVPRAFVLILTVIGSAIIH